MTVDRQRHNKQQARKLLSDGWVTPKSAEGDSVNLPVGIYVYVRSFGCVITLSIRYQWRNMSQVVQTA